MIFGDDARRAVILICDSACHVVPRRAATCHDVPRHDVCCTTCHDVPRSLRAATCHTSRQIVPRSISTPSGSLMHAKYGRNYVCRPSLFVGRTVQATCTCTVPTFRVFVRHLQRPTFPAVPASVSFSVLVVPAFICTRNCDASPRHRTQQKWFLCRLRRKKRINHRWAKPTSKASTLRTL